MLMPRFQNWTMSPFKHCHYANGMFGPAPACTVGNCVCLLNCRTLTGKQYMKMARGGCCRIRSKTKKMQTESCKSGHRLCKLSSMLIVKEGKRKSVLCWPHCIAALVKLESLLICQHQTCLLSICWCGNEWQQFHSVLYTSLLSKLSWHGSSKLDFVASSSSKLDFVASSSSNMLFEASIDAKFQLSGPLGELIAIAQTVSMLLTVLSACTILFSHCLVRNMLWGAEYTHKLYVAQQFWRMLFLHILKPLVCTLSKLFDKIGQVYTAPRPA